MDYDTGPQYPRDRQSDPTGFLRAARLHQSNFRSKRLRLPFHGYGNYLTMEDASNGKNFYDGFGIVEAARTRYPTCSEKVYANMLRSEHVPLNLFIPLNTNDTFRLSVFRTLFDPNIQAIGRIQIEYAPSPASEYLNDRSSFDAYVEYGCAGGRGLIGIEVKYTERAYSLKAESKENRETSDRTGRYFSVMSASGIYRRDVEPLVIQDEYRQIWRNQLLGESIIQRHPAQFAHATLITMYPSANIHIATACDGYQKFLQNGCGRFVGLTYERFIGACRNHIPSVDYVHWLDYVQDRYIVPR